ncbi:MAG: hypothetical protein VKL39_08230, partial [Leptolyngbyaceae bacterium]|nr:hypothetical protein [Leptolyngbyaceae bacterium]
MAGNRRSSDRYHSSSPSVPHKPTYPVEYVAPSQRVDHAHHSYPTPASSNVTTGTESDENVQPPKRPFYRHWAFWMTMIIAVSGGVTGFSLALLYKLPSLPNCPNIFWPTASASLRLYCAELAAKKNTTEDLLAAIQLMDGLPDDHPLRAEADEMIDGWSLSILDLADETFQQGDLDEAVAIARKIPSQGSAYSEVNQRIDHWQSTWAQAERIYQETISAVESDDLRKAFSSAVKLLNVGNTYWATEKYDELNEIIETTR